MSGGPWEDYAPTEQGPWNDYATPAKPFDKSSDPSEYDPDSTAFQSKYGPVSGNSFGRNTLVGAGKFFTDVGLGAQQMVGMAPPEAATEKRAVDAPIMGTAGGKIGYGGAALAAGVPLAMAAGATVPGAAMAGGVLGALQPAASVGERYLNTGTMAGYGALGQYGFNRLMPWLGSYAGVPRNETAGLTPEGVPVPSSGRVYVPPDFTAPTPGVRASYGPAPEDAAAAQAQAAGLGSAEGRAGASAQVSANPTASARLQGTQALPEVGPDPSAGLNSAQARTLKKAEALGFRVTPGVKTGSKALQQREAAAESRPWTSGPFFKIKAENTTLGNEITAKALGEKGNVVDDVAMAQADDRMGRVYEKIADDRVRAVDPDEFLGRLAEIEDEFVGLLKDNKSITDIPLVKQLYDLVGRGNITGRQAQNLSSKMARSAKTELTSAGGDREAGLALFKARELADDILAEGLDSDTAALFKTTRGQYRILKLLESGGVTNTAKGDVSLATLGNLLSRVDKKGYMYGRNQSDLYNAARFAQAFRSIVGDSGTATRSAGGTTVADITFGIPMNLAARAYTSNTATAGAGAAAAARTAASNAMRPVTDPFMAGAAKYVPPVFPYGIPGGAAALMELTRNR